MASQLPRLRHTVLPLAGLAATTLLTSSTVFAEAHVVTKKPIYDEPPPLPTVPESLPTYPTPTERLAKEIGKARRFINVHYRLACEKLDDAFSQYLSYEHSVTRTIAKLAPPKDSPEKVLPGAIYVAVATMAGGIIARRRIWPVRVLTPVVVGVASAWYFIPQTTQNVAELLWEWEKKVPRVAETHQQVRQSIEEAVRKTCETTVETRQKVDEVVHNVRKSAEDLVKRG